MQCLVLHENLFSTQWATCIIDMLFFSSISNRCYARFCYSYLFFKTIIPGIVNPPTVNYKYVFKITIHTDCVKTDEMWECFILRDNIIWSRAWENIRSCRWIWMISDVFTFLTKNITVRAKMHVLHHLHLLEALYNMHAM